MTADGRRAFPEEHVVDARGKRCPLPVIDLARFVAAHPGAARVLVLATDPAAAHDIPAWCRMRGHRFVEARPSDDHTTYVVDLDLDGQVVRQGSGPEGR